MAHAEAYKDDGTPAEQSRRTFMVNMVLALGGVIGLGITIPVLYSLAPLPDSGTAGGSPLTPDELATLQKATDKPIKVTFKVKGKDAYLPEAQNEEFVWAIKTDQAALKAKRPELFAGEDKLTYPAITIGFVLFSPICPHLGCKYSWNDGASKFICPCHGSQFTNLGEHVAGPALRGLDPLPLKSSSGTAEVTWIVYAPNTPHHIILSYA